jgi:hypothetical protein
MEKQSQCTVKLKKKQVAKQSDYVLKKESSFPYFFASFEIVYNM